MEVKQKEEFSIRVQVKLQNVSIARAGYLIQEEALLDQCDWILNYIFSLNHAISFFFSFIRFFQFL